MGPKDHGTLMADKVVVDTEFRKSRRDLYTKINSVHAFFGDEVMYASAIDREHVKVLVSKKTLKCELQLRTDGIEEVAVLNYVLNVLVAKERLSETMIKPV